MWRQHYDPAADGWIVVDATRPNLHWYGMTGGGWRPSNPDPGDLIIAMQPGTGRTVGQYSWNRGAWEMLASVPSAGSAPQSGKDAPPSQPEWARTAVGVTHTIGGGIFDAMGLHAITQLTEGYWKQAGLLDSNGRPDGNNGGNNG